MIRGHPPIKAPESRFCRPPTTGRKGSLLSFYTAGLRGVRNTGNVVSLWKHYFRMRRIVSTKLGIRGSATQDGRSMISVVSETFMLRSG